MSLSESKDKGTGGHKEVYPTISLNQLVIHLLLLTNGTVGVTSITGKHEVADSKL